MKKLRSQFEVRPITMTILLFALYTGCFFLTEQINTRDAVTLHCFIDDLIPFSRYAVLPYCLWFIDMPATLLFMYLRKDRDDFFDAVMTCHLCMICALPIYLLFPTQLDLRPASVPGNDLFSIWTRFIYTVDNSKNVCPSLHVAVSYLMARDWLKYGDRRQGMFMPGLNIIICISTLFLKQHSFIDVIGGVLWAIFIETVYDHFLSPNR